MGKQAKQRSERRQRRAKTDGNGDSAGDDAALVGALALLARRRAPYAPLLSAIVREACAAFSASPSEPATRPIVEIGAGGGQLRDWLSPAMAARTLATDPSPAALALLRSRARATPVAGARARAQALPFRDASCDGVVGLCVFDAIHAAGAETAAVAEIARVLAPGGRFVHLLDMATLLDAPFAKLIAGALVPIPNVFSDPADHEWPLDVLLLRRDWLVGLLELVARAGHPLPVEFGPFFQAFLAPAFDAGAAADRFKALAANGERRFALSSQIASACRVAAARGYPTPQPLPFHSGRYLSSLLETTFRDDGHFRIDLSRVVSRSAWQPAPAGAAAAPRYRSLALGHERVSATLPGRLLDESFRASPAAGDPTATLTEAAAHVFVATRVLVDERGS